jgi:hypothetical protein
MLKKTLAMAISGYLFAVLIYSGPARATPPYNLTGSFVVQASGTAYFFTCQTASTSCSTYPLFGQGTTEVLHFTMAGSATFINGSNSAVNLTLNLGGEDDNSTDAANDVNELICYLTQPGDLFYTAGTSAAPPMLTVTYHSGDTCIGPNGLPTGGVSEAGDIIPFNFYPYLPLPASPYPAPATGGVIVSNYTYLTTTPSGTTPVIGSNPQGWKDGGYPDSDVISGVSATGQVTPTFANAP